MVDDAFDTTQPGKHDDTQVETSAAADATTLVPSNPAIAAGLSLPPSGYNLGDAIGRGGMGEVIAARDLRIGREVAVKRMTAEHPSPEQVTRFLREARIQARLDHPSIVPVHELGVDDKGRLYFTMKRLAGKTLGAHLVDKLPLTRALRVLVDVCLATEFAHERGVVHRDLKPSNIMLGEYGEVYVIDWGIARVLGDDDDPGGSTPHVSTTDIATLEEGTKSGALLGTPGYMSPEQLRGQRATNAADVYALGSIMFEVLAGETLHRRGEAGIASTLGEPQQSPAKRKPEREIPPELDELCMEALAELPEDRPTARGIADRLQAFLDGDRDLARRRELALEQLALAKAAIDRGGADSRATAMRHAGHALALDPKSEEAGTMVSALLLEPPPKLPADLQRGLDDYETKMSADRSRQAVWAYGALFLLLPAIFVVHIKEWGLVIGLYGTLLLAVLAALRYRTTGKPSVSVVLAVNLALIVLFSRIASPFILTPLLVCGALTAFTSIRWINERLWIVITWTLLAVLLPIAIDYSGLLPRSWQMGEGFMVIRSNVLQSAGDPTALVLVTASVILHLALAMFLLGITRKRRIAQNQLFIQAWHLRQLLPTSKT